MHCDKFKAEKINEEVKYNLMCIQPFYNILYFFYNIFVYVYYK